MKALANTATNTGASIIEALYQRQEQYTIVCFTRTLYSINNIITIGSECFFLIPGKDHNNCKKARGQVVLSVALMIVRSLFRFPDREVS